MVIYKLNYVGFFVYSYMNFDFEIFL